jgi:toxin CcdB
VAQFTVHENPNPATREHYPYLLDIQNDLLYALRTCIVIPLSPQRITAGMQIGRLNPVLSINGEKFILMTQELAGIDRHMLGTEVCNIAQHRDDIIAAMDFVLSGI